MNVRGKALRLRRERIGLNLRHRLPGLIRLTALFVFINAGQLVQQGCGLLGEFFKHLDKTHNYVKCKN